MRDEFHLILSRLADLVDLGWLTMLFLMLLVVVLGIGLGSITDAIKESTEPCVCDCREVPGE